MNWHKLGSNQAGCVPYEDTRMARPLCLIGLFLALAGCNRQDAECMSRIGRKVSAHAKSSAGEIGAKLDLGKREPSLHEKVHDRLRFDKTLKDVVVEIQAKEKEIELTGTVNEDAQRLRAVELAETVVGVEKVIDSIKVKEAE
jgi:osmotically-inducible protein OsmY